MAHASEIALDILKALTEARTAGRTPHAIVLDDTTRENFQALGLGYWSAGPGAWSLFSVPVVTGLVSGWRLRLLPEPSKIDLIAENGSIAKAQLGKNDPTADLSGQLNLAQGRLPLTNQALYMSHVAQHVAPAAALTPHHAVSKPCRMDALRRLAALLGQPRR